MKDGSSRECFANAFASRFILPQKALNEFLDNANWRDYLNPQKVVCLASTFRASYAFMLLRLLREKLITDSERDHWSKLSPIQIGHALGIDTSIFEKSDSDKFLHINRYPLSVLTRVADMIESEELTESQAARLLDVDELTLRDALTSFPVAGPEEKEFANEFQKV